MSSLSTSTSFEAPLSRSSENCGRWEHHINQYIGRTGVLLYLHLLIVAAAVAGEYDARLWNQQCRKSLVWPTTLRLPTSGELSP